MKSTLVIAMSEQTTTVLPPTSKSFTFDYSYWSHDPQSANFASQDIVHSDIGEPICSNALNGFNGCLFAYGQTGAGKSYSVLGYRDAPGIIPRAVEEIYHQKSAYEGTGKELRVWVSYIEIYNEHIHDLLVPTGGGEVQEELRVVESPALGVYIPSLTESPCHASADVDRLLDYGTKRRVTAATAMNATSSRSHAVFIIKVNVVEGSEKGKNEKGKTLSSKICLVDLAGSERQSKTGASGQMLKEGCAINQSLSALGMVIKELSETASRKKQKKGDDHVPFRSSKLTFILKECLSGNSKTYMIAAISPALDNAEETVSTLRFASSVKKIKTVAKQNMEKKDELIMNLQDEIKKLKAQLGDGGSEIAGQIADRQGAMEELRKSYNQQLAEHERLGRIRSAALEDMGLSIAEISDTFGMENDTPYLMNLSGDPMLAGCILYYLKANELTTVGSAAGNTIVLKGLGIADNLCQFQNSDNKTLLISLQSVGADVKPPRLLINGKSLQHETVQPLRHRDRLIFGRSSAFRLQIPIFMKRDDPKEFNLPDEEQLIKELLPEESASLGEVQYQLEDMYEQLGEAGPEFLRGLQEVCHLVDEANDISQHLRPSDRFKFEVEFVHDMYNETSGTNEQLVIRLLRMPQSGDKGDPELLYYWHIRKLQERLELMRDAFHTYERVGKWPGLNDPLMDPWHEVDFVEIQHRLDAKGTDPALSGAKLLPEEIAGKSQVGARVLPSFSAAVTKIARSDRRNGAKADSETIQGQLTFSDAVSAVDFAAAKRDNRRLSDEVAKKSEEIQRLNEENRQYKRLAEEARRLSDENQGYKRLAEENRRLSEENQRLLQQLQSVTKDKDEVVDILRKRICELEKTSRLPTSLVPNGGTVISSDNILPAAEPFWDLKISAEGLKTKFEQPTQAYLPPSDHHFLVDADASQQVDVERPLPSQDIDRIMTLESQATNLDRTPHVTYNGRISPSTASRSLEPPAAHSISRGYARSQSERSISPSPVSRSLEPPAAQSINRGFPLLAQPKYNVSPSIYVQDPARLNALASPWMGSSPSKSWANAPTAQTSVTQPVAPGSFLPRRKPTPIRERP